ncbi:MAG: hypothetical protein KAW12_08615 [Candidatus Aminicenantes bacterium]|nr:hypothetical protein [Candidatus Aminicenantes bacterium]
MELQKIFKVISFAILGFTLVFIFFGISGKGKVAPPEEFDADGRGMISLRFNKDNQKVIEVTCSESERETDDRVLMKDIKATIFKKGRRKHDMIISGDKGIVENNFYNFTIQDNARIFSEDLSITCNSFSMQDRAILTSEDQVNYRLKSMQGIAKKGMRINVKKNILFFYETTGTYSRKNNSFNYKTDHLQFEDKKRSIRLFQGNEISNDETILKGKMILLAFSEEYDHIAEISAWENCYFYREKKNGTKEKEFREISAGHIKSLYNREGNLKKTGLEHQVDIRLKTKANTTDISSPSAEIFYDEKTGHIRNIKMMSPSNIKNTGKNNFEANSYKMEIEYNKNGEISTCKSRGNSNFTIDDYSGTSFLMSYEVDKNLINLRGKGSKVIYKRNAFVSTRFNVNTKKKRMESDSGVKSIILLNTEKDNVLFSEDLIYINSKKVKISNKKGIFNYEDDVDLRQKNTILTCDELKIDEDNNLIASGEQVSLSFKNKEDDISIKGKKIMIKAKEREVEIRRGILRSGENTLRAQVLKIAFNQGNEISEIYGEEKIDFIKAEDNTSGSSEKVRWFFRKDEIVFIDSARIQKQDSGVTKGSELRLFLKDNRITISSDKSKRTQTTIDKK